MESNNTALLHNKIFRKEKICMAKRLYNRTLLQIFSILFFVTCIMFIFNFVVFNNSVLTMNEQISQNNRLMVRNIIQKFDQCFEEINTKIFDLNSLSAKIYSKFDQSIDLLDARHIISTASSLFTQSYIEGFVIFFDDYRLVLTERGTEDFKITFEKKYKNNKYPPEFWRSFAAVKHPPIVVPSGVYTDVSQHGISHERRLLAIIGNTQTKVTRLNIIVFINEKELLNYVNHQSMSKDSSLIVLDQDKNVILNAGNYTGNDISKDIDNYLSKLYFNSGNESLVKKDNYEYFSVKSDYNNYIYIYRIPSSLNAAFNVIKINQIILFSTLLIGIVVSILSSLFLYRPIKYILELIDNRYSKPSYNKFKQIYYGIEMMKKENKLIENQIEIVKDDIIRGIFLKLIDDYLYYRNITKEELAYFKSIFNCRNFFIVLFNIELCLENETSYNDFSANEILFILKKYLEQNFDNCIVFHYNSIQFIALVGINKKVKFIDLPIVIQDIIDDFMSKMFKGYNITAFLSNLYSHAEDCNKAFKDIKICAGYRTIKPSKKVFDTSDCNNNYNLNFCFPADTIEKFTNFFLTGNLKESKNAISKIFDIITENSLSYMELIYISTYIFTNIINVMTTNGIERSEIIKFESNFWEMINYGKNYYEIKSFFEEIIEHTIQKSNYNKKNKLNREFVFEYINLHYSEDLYLEKLADIVGTSPKYFSNFFKRSFGISFIDYLNRIRISHAKDYLKNTDIPISEISNKLGYTHSRTFTNIFKKYIGVPPTEYRKQFR